MSILLPHQVRSFVHAITHSDNQTKQDLGRRVAYYLGFTPGPSGPDGGIDGIVEAKNMKIHFQSKLCSTPLGVDEARAYYSDLDFHRIDVSIMVSGVGYKDTFFERIKGQVLYPKLTLFLLTLEDILVQSDEFLRAMDELPMLRDFQDIDWSEFA